jgi:hypothetical protein
MASQPLFIDSSPRYRPTELASGEAMLKDAAEPRQSESRDRRIPTDTLYNDWDESTQLTRQAIRIMGEAGTLLKSAIELLDSDPIASDDAMNHLTPLLTELFCCREIGQGFSSVSNALLCAVQNHATERWQRHQLIAVARELSGLRAEPFLRFENAIDAVERLESAGLVPEPKGFEYLSDWLDGESIR